MRRDDLFATLSALLFFAGMASLAMVIVALINSPAP